MADMSQICPLVRVAHYHAQTLPQKVGVGKAFFPVAEQRFKALRN